uniref:Uncharacterized protein n=1 Tax=Arabidopsis thaliana TaxID=3702 RepID=Q0WSY8_ARATH|nr:hypothetical protein [Arabidopsis thaliana]
MIAASLAAALDLSWINVSCSLLILPISWTLQASSLEILSFSRYSSVSKNLFCIFSCFSINSFVNFVNNPFQYFLFFLELLT